MSNKRRSRSLILIIGGQRVRMKLVPVSDGVLLTPGLRGRDFHFTMHSSSGGVFHCEDQGATVADLFVRKLESEFEEIKAKPKVVESLQKFVQDRLVYIPKHNENILVYGFPKQMELEICLTESQATLVDCGKMLEYIWHAQVPAQQLAHFIGAVYRKTGIEEFLAFDLMEKVSVAIEVVNGSRVIMLQFPCDLSNIEDSRLKMYQLFIDLLTPVPSLKEFVQNIASQTSDLSKGSSNNSTD